jgi:hypothetical protein
MRTARCCRACRIAVQSWITSSPSLGPAAFDLSRSWFPANARWTLPLYDLAITTARRGWHLGIPAATYWFVTPEPEPLAGFGPAMSIVAHQRLEPEGITFIGSTYADVRHGVVLLDPQAERIEPDRIVGLNRNGELLLDWRAARRGRIHHIVAEPTSAPRGSPNGASQRGSGVLA